MKSVGGTIPGAKNPTHPFKQSCCPPKVCASGAGAFRLLSMKELLILPLHAVHHLEAIALPCSRSPKRIPGRRRKNELPAPSLGTVNEMEMGNVSGMQPGELSDD